ncbi:MAG: NAD(P)-dependent oxidoreductase [Solirubrobacteraceae bacterium]|nr:NAD(P)-dependent oxidoreductase [Solirubrobacteraceae bacterium]
MSTLVTGGTGFVGINIVRDLAEAGHDVIAVDVGAPDALAEQFVAPWAERVTWVTGDLTDAATLERAAAGKTIDRIVDAAAYTPYEDEERTHFRRTMDNNVGAHLNVLDLAVAQSVERVVFVSTMAVYTSEYYEEQTGDVVLAESLPCDPHHVYGISKQTCEGLLRRAGQLFGFETASVRLSQNWGTMERLTPFHSRMSIPYAWVRDAVAGTPIEVSPFGSGITNGRMLNMDHPYVQDTAAAIRGLLETSTLRHDLYNVSAGPPIYVDDMLAAMRAVAPDATFAEPVTADGPADRPSIALDTTRLVEDTGFAPAWDLERALAHCIAWRRATGFASD